MKWKYMRLFLSISCCLFLALSIYIYPINIIKAEDEIFGNDTVVTFGLYSTETGQIETSQPDYFFDHIRYGMAHGIYNYYKRIYGENANFPSEVSIFYQRLIDIFGTDFFESLSSNRWLLNVYVSSNGRVFLLFNRVPVIRSGPIFEKRSNINDKYTIELLPENYKASFYIFTYSGVSSYCPYYYNDNVNFGNNDSYLETANFTQFATFEEVKQALSDQNIRSFELVLEIALPSMTVSLLETPSLMKYNAYYNIETLKAFSIEFGGGYTMNPVMVDFPVYSYMNSNKNFIRQGGSYPNYKTRYYYNKAPEYLEQDMILSPIIISGYFDIPQPTPTPTRTPTPAPTWTPYPTATPFPPVNEIEGISQMMTLFTRKYEFNIKGNVIGIRPLYLFVFTFLVGAIFKAIQGGDRN